jgi:hypothetical protein
VVRLRSCRVIYYFDTPTLGIRHQLFDRVKMCFTYKVVTPDIIKKQNNFLEFLKYWSSSRDFNKLIIKPKMHANTYF